jgi:hypothetical protein
MLWPFDMSEIMTCQGKFIKKSGTSLFCMGDNNSTPDIY